MNINTIDVKLLTKMFKYGTAKLVSKKPEIDALNVFPVPDGDTGTNMSLTMTNAIERLGTEELASVEEVAKRIAKGSLMGARGNSGVILSQIFRGFAKGCEGKTELTVTEFTTAIGFAAKTAYKAVLKPVEGTILTVIREIAESFEEVDENMTYETCFEQMIRVGNTSLDNTPNLLPALKQAGVIDSGGKGLMTILEGFADVMAGKAGDDFEIEVEAAPVIIHDNMPAQAHMHTEDIKFTYCTEFIIRGENLADVPLKEDIIDMGDSMVYVADDDLLKVHIHTNHPGECMEKALKYGALIKVKIENMKEQHSTILDAQGDNVVHTPSFVETPQAEVNAPKKHIGIVAVAMGDGMTTILKDLGVDVVISGGQTMNPSTEDIHRAIDRVNADNILVFPNNSNIIMAATQAAELCDVRVDVIPSKTVLQCITAMLNYVPDGEMDDNVAMLSDAVSDVKSIQITHAVRDTEVDGVDIKEGDFLGILDGSIVMSTAALTDTVLSTLDKAVESDAEIITIYYGSEVTEDDAAALHQQIEEKYDDLDVDLQMGGQPVYHYLISIE